MHKKTNKTTQSWQNIQKSTEESFIQGKDYLMVELKEFRRLVRKWRDEELQIKKDCSGAAVLVQYAQCLEEVNNSDRLRKLFYVRPIRYDQHMKGIKNQKQILLGINFLDQKDWKITFSKNFVKKLKTLSEASILRIFQKMYMTSQGIIPFTEGKQNTYKAYQRGSKFPMRYFTLQMEIDNDISYLLITVGTHKVPHYDFNNANGAKIEYFSYVMMITAEEIIHRSKFYNEKVMRMAIDNIEDYYEENPRMNYQKNELRIDEEALNEKKNYFHSKKRDNQQKAKIYPTLYKHNPINELQIENFGFLLEKFDDFQRRSSYLAKMKANKENIQKAQKQQYYGEEYEQNEEQNELIEMLQLQTARNEKFEFSNHSKILQNLKQIPNFKYNLTHQQKEVLVRNGNLIIVGRSGTGKTTCAMLRLYGIEFLVKMNQFNNLKKQGKIQITAQKCGMMLMNEIQLLKNIFLTFSGMLIDQIKKQYDDMIFQIHDKHAQTKNCEPCKASLKQNKPDDEEEDPLDKLKRRQQEQEKKVISLDSISKDDFPGFFTIENFIRIIDKTVPRPFFSHKKQHNNQKNHNAVIKHAFINRYEYTSAEIIHLKTVEAVYVDYNFFVNQIWESLPRQLTKPSKDLCLLTPAIVWSEIFSILKGSLKSYLCPEGYISLKMYIDDHQSIFQREPQRMHEYKQKVYKILKSYVNWCRNQSNAYDLMDVVNHNLRQIEFYGYLGPKINYMFVDEVQDLTASTTFLISKMVINNIFYCGDTAQAITKGVSFRFEDLKFIFNKEYCKNAIKLDSPQDIIYLTVNFRSHHFILQLANSIVCSIQQLFPNSINKINKEKSDLIGPKPFILLNQNTSMLFYLICGPLQIKNQDINGDDNLRDLIKQSEKKQRQKFQKKRPKKSKNRQKRMEQMNQDDEFDEEDIDSDQQEQPRKFNSEQIIIVRNLQEKRKLPKALRQGIVLIPETAKGLEFDEVILYNFFSSCPIFQKWNSLLQHLDSQEVYQDAKKFEQELSRRNKQQKDQQQPLTQQTKRLLGYDENRKQYKLWNIRGKQSIHGVNINLYLQLASELKILYTVITRARSVFAIFDQKLPKNLLRLWKELDLITIVDEKNVQQCHLQINNYVYVKQKHKKYINQDRHWFKAGSQMLARKDYDNAKKCFRNIKRYDIVERIEALQIQIKAENILYRVKNGFKNLQTLQRDDRKIKKIKLERQKKEAYQLYVNAGKIYEKHTRNNDAAEAYFKAEEYQLSLRYNKLINNTDKIAICCKKLKRYKEAINIFRQNDDIEGMVGCFIEQKNWTSLFKMLIDNPSYMHKFDELNNIALECIRKVLEEKFEGQPIKRAEQYYTNFYGISMVASTQNKNNYDQHQFTLQIKKLVLQSQYLSLKTMLSKLEAQVKKYEQLQNAYHGAKAQLQLSLQEESEILQKIDKIKQLKNSLLNSEKQNKDKIQTYEASHLIEELFELAQYKQLQSQLQIIDREKVRAYRDHQALHAQLNELHNSIFMLEANQKRLREQYECFTEKYQFKKNQMGIAILSRKIKQVIDTFCSLQKHEKPKQGASNAKKDKFNDNLSQICSVSDISQMAQIWDIDCNNIGGLHLFPQEKEQLLKQIQQVLRMSNKIMENVVEDNYRPFHHKYVEQKLFKYLIQKSSSQTYSRVLILKACNRVEQNKSCLLMCDFYKQFICLSPKYILGYLLQFSNNFKQNRYFDNQMYQIEVKQDNEQEQQQVQENKLNDVEKFLATLNDHGLMHKIPRIAFESKFYYETILSHVYFGLVLQGFFQQSLMFCEPGQACRLAYLYSSYEKLLYYVKIIAKNLNIRNLHDKQFLFTEDERILHYYPEATVLNIFSIQNIFYAYDECQVEPFLSKKKTQKQFDIEEVIIKHFYDYQAENRIKIMKKDKDSLQFEIRRLQQQINYYKECKRQKKYEKQLLDKINQGDKRRLKSELNELGNRLNELRQQLQKISTEKSKAQHELNKATIPQALKKQYENKLTSMLFQINELFKNGKYHESQKLKRKRMDFDEQYKQKRQQEKMTYQDYQKMKNRQKMKQGQINQTKKKMTEIHRQLQAIQQQIKKLTNRQIQQHFDLFIANNQQLITKCQKQIPTELDIKDEQKLKDAVVKRMINEEKRLRFEAWMQELKQGNMQKIQKSSNIPKSEHFKFLAKYMKGQLDQKSRYKNSQQTSHLYYEMLKDGIQINRLIQRKENRDIADIKICNIIIFYLSYICNQSMRHNINESLMYANKIFKENQLRRRMHSQQYKTAKHWVEFYEMKLLDIHPNLRVKANRDYNNITYDLNNARIKYNQLAFELDNYKDFPQNPTIMLDAFMDIIFKKIKTLQASQLQFMEILFGFFQCRVIRECQMLDFLANQYVLVRHNSIVLQKMQQQNRKCFAYYFDQNNQTVLCRFQDVQRIILGFIEKKHSELYRVNYPFANKQIKHGNQPKFMQKQVLGYINKVQTEQMKQMLELTQFINYNDKKNIKTLYDSIFIGDSMMKEVKQAKKSILEYYLQQKLTNSDQYYFASHQLRQYYFLQKILTNTQNFNYQMLKDVKKKKEALQRQYQMYVQERANNRGKK